MRLVLHPKVYSDIDRIMDYYERVATAQLASQFYAELRSLMAVAAAQPEYFSIRGAIFGGQTFIASRIVFFFELSKALFGFSWCVITVGIRR